MADVGWRHSESCSRAHPSEKVLLINVEDTMK